MTQLLRNITAEVKEFISLDLNGNIPITGLQDKQGRVLPAIVRRLDKFENCVPRDAKIKFVAKDEHGNWRGYGDYETRTIERRDLGIMPILYLVDAQ